MRIQGEVSGPNELESILGEIDCCKGILYSLVGINRRIVERLQVRFSCSLGRSMASQAYSISELGLERNLSSKNFTVEQMKPLREISPNVNFE